MTFLESLKEYQGRHRPMLTHSIVLALHGDKFDASGRKTYASAASVPDGRNVLPTCLSTVCGWGASPEKPVYDPIVDGGLCIEVMPMEPLQMPPIRSRCLRHSRAIPSPAIWCGFLRAAIWVRDLNETLRRCSANLDWEPSGPVELIEGRRPIAVRAWALAWPIAPRWDIIEATRWNSEAGLYLKQLGPWPLLHPHCGK